MRISYELEDFIIWQMKAAVKARIIKLALETKEMNEKQENAEAFCVF